jgi:hypothetical protein
MPTQRCTGRNRSSSGSWPSRTADNHLAGLLSHNVPLNRDRWGIAATVKQLHELLEATLFHTRAKSIYSIRERLRGKQLGMQRSRGRTFERMVWRAAPTSIAQIRCTTYNARASSSHAGYICELATLTA